MKHLTVPLIGFCLAGPLLAQGGAFQTPGMPARSASGQTDRFSSEFNPSLGGVIDSLLTWRSTDGSNDDGVQIALRSVEATMNAWVDPSTWAYVVVVASPDEGVNVEEAAVNYNGFGGHTSVRAGRFFVDFGKQMQAHEHDLATFERPAVLRAYLGEELGGDGVQFDDWFAAGDEGAIRYSLAIFDSLAPVVGSELDASTSEYKDASNLAYTARLTGFHDAGERGVFQWGLSARGLPDFALDTTLGNGGAVGTQGLS
ncbi:MAG TPA: hypothetical protein P5218_07425, partial [Planctomycetota bacterium]|nr:hypothetical protein [Planctomycetota bacterium]